MSATAARRPREKLAVSEIFESIQGEGASAGLPCLFLRLAHCNLTCRWCDTKYSWDFQSYRYEDEVSEHELTELATRLDASPARRVVVTGGEPLIQRDALGELFTRLTADLAIEIETNGTLMPSDALLARVTQWNVSPKLENSGEPLEKRIKHAVLTRLLATGRAYLKLVVASPEELAEVETLVSLLAWPRERVLLMPQAANRRDLLARGELVRGAARERGLGYSTRLHVEQWDGARGR